MRVRLYGEGRPGSLLVIIAAPIKRPYLWDLAPGRSVIGGALEAGFGVAVVEWTDTRSPLGLEDYVGRLLRRAADALHDAYGEQRLRIIGHSLGGTFAALFAASYPERVQRLGLLEAPLRFGLQSGGLGAVASLAPWVPAAMRIASSPVAGTLIDVLGVLSFPHEFMVRRWLDMLASAPDREAWHAHARVLRWALDEFAMPTPLFADVIGLCRDDTFTRGGLVITGRTAKPERLGMPVLAVVDEYSVVAPPQAVLPVLRMANAERVILSHTEREPGYAIPHLAAIVGRQAHAEVWPAIFDWLKR
jgi:polyhydroxyalkanoate synthase